MKINVEVLDRIPKNVTRLALVSALAAGYGLALHPRAASAQELGKNIAQATTVRSLDKNITSAEAVRLPLEIPSSSTSAAPEQAPQVDVNKLIPTVFVEMGDSR